MLSFAGVKLARGRLLKTEAKPLGIWTTGFPLKAVTSYLRSVQASHFCLLVCPPTHTHTRVIP